MRHWGLMAAVALVAAPGAAAAQDGDPFEWSGRLAEGQTVEIKGVNGSIEATGASGSQVEVRATKRAREDDPSEVRVEVVEHAGGVTICAVYPTPRRAREENRCAPGDEGRMNTENNDVQVHFTVRVPAGVRLNAHTVNGGIEASGLRSNVEATSVNGSVDVETTGTAEASSVNGRVRLAMGRADWSGTLSARSVNGGVSVTLPADASFEVTGSTVNGDITSDFPVTVRGRFGPRRVTGTVRDGGRSLELETVNGEIEIRRAS